MRKVSYISLRQLPPRLVRVLLVYIYIYDSIMLLNLPPQIYKSPRNRPEWSSEKQTRISNSPLASHKIWYVPFGQRAKGELEAAVSGPDGRWHEPPQKWWFYYRNEHFRRNPVDCAIKIRILRRTVFVNKNSDLKITIEILWTNKCQSDHIWTKWKSKLWTSKCWHESQCLQNSRVGQ